MLKINITQMIAAVQESPSFAFPEMNKGTSYLFKSVYCPLSNEESILVSNLDFSAFDLEDIGSLRDLYFDTFQEKSYQVNGITNALRKIAPACKPATYV